MTSYYSPAILTDSPSVYFLSPFNLKKNGVENININTVQIPQMDVLNTLGTEIWGNVKHISNSRGTLDMQITGEYWGTSPAACDSYILYLRAALQGRAADGKFSFFQYWNDKYFKDCWCSNALQYEVHSKRMTYSFGVSTNRWDLQTDLSVTPSSSPFYTYYYSAYTGGEIALPTLKQYPISVMFWGTPIITPVGYEYKAYVNFPTGITSQSVKRVQVNGLPDATETSGNTTVKVNLTGVGGAGQSISASLAYNASSGTSATGTIALVPGDVLNFSLTAIAGHSGINAIAWVEG